MKVAVILPAAGLGTRMGEDALPAENSGTSRKQFMLLEGSPILVHTVRKFAASTASPRSWWRCAPKIIEWVASMLRREVRGRRVRVVGRRQQPAGIGGERACARSIPIPNWWRCTTRCGRSSIWKPFARSSTKPPRPARRSSASCPVDTVKQVSGAQPSDVRVRVDHSARETGAGADSAGVPLRHSARALSKPRARDGFIGTDESSLVERLDSRSQRGARQRPQHQDHQARRHGSGAAVLASRKPPGTRA